MALAAYLFCAARSTPYTVIQDDIGWRLQGRRKLIGVKARRWQAVSRFAAITMDTPFQP